MTRQVGHRIALTAARLAISITWCVESSFRSPFAERSIEVDFGKAVG
jgi:hypothetical protein